MVPEDLRRLAAAHGVATCYRNERRELVQVDADVVIRILRLLEVEAGNETDRRRELVGLNEHDRAAPPRWRCGRPVVRSRCPGPSSW